MTSKTLFAFDPKIKKSIDSWLQAPYDTATQSTIHKLLEENPQALVDAFYCTLSFGTGGMRGLMGVGTNRMNRYTIRTATQGLADYINTQPKSSQGYSVCIGYDSRHHSREFAEEAAMVLAGNGITVHLFKELRPTPLISFACRYLKCTAAIMITASHNPPEYNGYKVYWGDGGQVLPPHDQHIVSAAQKHESPATIKSADNLNHPLIRRVGSEVDDAYLKAIKPLQLDPQKNIREGHKLRIVYTSLHGTGITLVPQALAAAGFSNLHFVDKQIIPDGDFPTAKSPNPEETATLALGIQKLNDCKGDILIANDPDADRVGVAVAHRGEVVQITGNQMLSLCLHYVLETLSIQKRLPEQAAFVKTIVTTELFQAICTAFHRPCFNVLTGFKYIAEQIRHWESDPAHTQEYVFGGEESSGCLIGTIARDKDAVSATVLIAEMAIHAQRNGLTLVDKLNELYNTYGFYYDRLISINFEESKAGKEKMAQGIHRMQSAPPHQICGVAVTSIEDYRLSIKWDLTTNEKTPITLPPSDVLLFWLADHTKLVIRPSGTEPKIKIYVSIVNTTFASLKEAGESSKAYAERLIEAFKSLLSN